MTVMRPLALSLSLVLLCSGVRAEVPAREMPATAVDISSPTLLKALIALQQQTGLQFICPTDGTGETHVPAVSGIYTPRAAVEKLLKDSGVKYEFINEKTVAISSNKTPPARTSAVDIGGSASGERISLAQADIPAQSETTRVAEARSTGTQLEEVKVSIPEILVQGSRILNMDIKRSRDDIQPYVVFDRKKIEASGSQNVEEFLRDQLTSMRGPLTAAQQGFLGGDTTSKINLRGLGAEQTLILVDGHRIASPSSGGSPVQPDLNGIPLAAIERIEVLPVTASGIYGGSATGGVINVILRRDYSGLETKLGYDNSFDGGGATRRVDLAAGFDLEGGKTNLLLTGSYSDSSDLLARDRVFLRRGRAQILRNNPSALLGASPPPVGATSNIATPSQFDFATFQFVPGPNLVLDDGTPLNANSTFVPVGYAGPASDNGAALVNNAGHFNLDPAHTAQLGSGDRQALVATPTVKSLSLTVRREFSSWLSAFVDASSSENEGVFVGDMVASNFFLLADDLANPFQQDIYVTTPGFGTEQSARASNYNDRVMGGLLFKLPKNWQAEADFTWNKTRTTNVYPSNTLTFDANVAVASGMTSSGAPFDVFRDTNVSPVDFSPYLAAPSTSSPSHVTLTDSTMRLAGPIGWALPAGQPTLTTLLEHRKEAIGTYTFTDPAFTSTLYGSSQSTDSIYMELNVPVVSSQNAMPGIAAFDIQIAGRHDEYDLHASNQSFSIPGIQDPTPVAHVDSSLSSTDPTIGLRYKPISDLALRASYATGFVPPSMTLLVPGPAFTGDGVGFGLTDPRRGNEPLGQFTYGTGGNPNLRPEKSESRSAGVIFTPRFAPGLRLALDWTKIEKRDNISAFAPRQSDINNELLIPGFITRGPASDGFDVGPIIAFGPPWINVAHLKVEAYDLALDYTFETSRWGALAFSAAATRNMHFETQVLSSLPKIESIGSSFLPWQGNISMEWDFHRWTALWSARYFDSYCLNLACAADINTLSQGSLSVPSQTYHDLSLLYQFGSDSFPSLLANTDIRFGVRNVFNKKPPVDVVNNTESYYSTYGDPRLSSYFLSVRKSFF